jgi:peptide/nickel transport system permease protein
MFTRKNIITYIVALGIILTLNFFLPRMMPGDPLMAIYGDEALVQMSPELKADIIERFDLDQSLGKQFITYWSSLFHGDLGYSYSYNATVISVIAGCLPYTLLLAGLALVFSTLLGIIFGIESGWRRGRAFDKGILSGMVALSGFPDFFLGLLLLLLFAVYLKVFPLFGAENAYSGLTGIERIADYVKHIILPLAALILTRLSSSYLLTRNNMIGVLNEPYILLARAKGLQPQTVKYKHAGRNSMLPVLTHTGIWLGLMATGVLFIEVIFSYPGIGLLTYKALTFRDYPVLQGILLVSALCVLVVNFIIDLLYTRIDPRVNYAR